MQRIGIPFKGIQLITELHTDRQARIITAHGLTSPVHIKSGIEQGETYSPLLWKIYYDPILTYIHNKYNNHLLKITCFLTIQLLTNLPIIPLILDDINFNKLSTTIKTIKNFCKTLYHTRDIENKQAISQQITQHVQTRYNNFTSNTTTMINSIINRHTDPVLFDNKNCMTL